MRVALYARVSTDDQTVAPQLDALREYARARGLEVVAEHIDEGVSGRKDRRPALDKLLADARRRRFDAVAVVKLDRLGRSLHHLLTLLGEFEALGVDLIAVDDGLDTTTPVGRLFYQIRGAFAEYETELIRERTRAGLQAAKKRGKRLGRPRVHVPIAEARRLLAEGLSLTAVARHLGIARSTLQRALTKNVPAEAVATPRQVAA